jgi:16S rRNA (adenine1518-N6/adenine1519-N6)-dimethyltransferase
LPGQAAKLGISDKEKFLELVKVCFAHKRKTLVNNLKSLGESGEIRGALERCGIRGDARAEQVNVAEFAKLAGELAALPTK